MFAERPDSTRRPRVAIECAVTAHRRQYLWAIDAHSFKEPYPSFAEMGVLDRRIR